MITRGTHTYIKETISPFILPYKVGITAAPRTTRPVALTPRQDRRRLWQEKQATLRLRHNNRAKKRYAASFDFVSFSFFSSFSLLQQGPGKGDTPKRILPREGTRLRASLLIRGSKAGPPGRVRQPPQIAWALHPLLIRGSKAGPSEGSHDSLRLLGLRAHY
jgi:hypothetical protein